MKPALVILMRTFPLSACDGNVALPSTPVAAISATARLVMRAKVIGVLLCVVQPGTRPTATGAHLRRFQSSRIDLHQYRPRTAAHHPRAPNGGACRVAAMKAVSVEDAVAMIPDGASLMIGGFMGAGAPARGGAPESSPGEHQVPRLATATPPPRDGDATPEQTRRIAQ